MRKSLAAFRCSSAFRFRKSFTRAFFFAAASRFEAAAAALDVAATAAEAAAAACAGTVLTCNVACVG